MTATVYTDFTLYKWLWDIEQWYNTNHYPKGYTGQKNIMDTHLKVMRSHYNYDQIVGDNIREKRINFFNFCQRRTEIEMARMI